MLFNLQPVDCTPSRSLPSLRKLWRAYLLLSLRNPREPRAEVAAWAQIDSGADLSLFPGELASLLGITIPNDRGHPYHGVGGTRHTAYFNSIEVGILDWQTEAILHRFEIEAGFSEALDPRGSGILGIHGFFSQFQVTFLRHQVDIRPF